MENDNAISQSEMRRLPIYLILWCSSRMVGQPLANELAAANQLLNVLRGDPDAAKITHVGLITVGSPQVTMPLTPLDRFVLPPLEAAGLGHFSQALQALSASLENNTVSNTTRRRRDYSPLVYVFMFGKPIDNWRTWRTEASRIMQLRGNKRPFIVGLALDSAAQVPLAGLTSTVIAVESDGIQPTPRFISAVQSSLHWMSDTLAPRGTDARKVTLPPSPDTVVDYEPMFDAESEPYAMELGTADAVFARSEHERVRSIIEAEVARRADDVARSPDGQAVIELPAPSSEARIWEQPSDAPSPQADSAESGSGANSEDASGVTSQSEQVTFTAYHPKELPLHSWAALVTYISLDTLEQRKQVERQATERLASQRDVYRPASSISPAQLRRGSMLTFVPRLPGLRVNPQTLTVAWEEDVQQVEFRIRADHVSPGQAVNGVIQVFAGPLLRADIPISIFLRSQEVQESRDDNVTRVLAHAYRRVFASYSHRDTTIVRACETAVETIGDRYLRDVRLLRSGEQWDERLLEAIGEADVFQLFWSRRAAVSPAVEHEWRHALSLAAERNAFIRPVYWSRQPYHVPSELNSIHFERLDLTTLGMGAVRRFFYVMTS